MACKFCGYDHESTGCPPKVGAVYYNGFIPTNDQRALELIAMRKAQWEEEARERRNYQILQAAATIKAARSTEMGVSPGVGATSVPTGRTIAFYSDEQSVQIAESLLAIIESRSK